MNKSNIFLSLETNGFQTKNTYLMDSNGEFKETYFTKGDVQLIVTTKGNDVLWDTIVYSDKNDSGSTIFSNENDVRDWLYKFSGAFNESGVFNTYSKMFHKSVIK